MTPCWYCHKEPTIIVGQSTDYVDNRGPFEYLVACENEKCEDWPHTPYLFSEGEAIAYWEQLAKTAKAMHDKNT